MAPGNSSSKSFRYTSECRDSDASGLEASYHRYSAAFSPRNHSSSMPAGRNTWRHSDGTPALRLRIDSDRSPSAPSTTLT